MRIYEQKKNVQDEFGAVAENYELRAFKESKGLNYVNKLEKDFVWENLKNKSSVIIGDLGTGSGRLAREISKLDNVQLISIDISKKMVKVARRSVSLPAANFIVADIENLPLRQGTLDVAICIRVIKYAFNTLNALKEIEKALTSGGTFVVEFSNKISVQRVGYFVAKKVFHKLYTLPQMIKLLELSGFRMKKRYCFAYIPFPILKKINGKMSLFLLRLVENLIERGFGRLFCISKFVLFECEAP